MIRRPAVCGTFYPSDPEDLRSAIDSYLSVRPHEEESLAVLSPHAGYIYSGVVAGEVFSSVQAPQTAIILCPNHTGRPRRAALWTGDGWETPFGVVPIDSELGEAILNHCKDVEQDTAAHDEEHAIEVQVPFLQARNAAVKIVPIVVNISDLEDLRRLGSGLAAAIRQVERPVGEILLVASSDMTHYEPQDAVEEKDHAAIDAMLRLDEAALLAVVRERHITMCGYGPAAAVIACVKELGATRAVLRRYRTSGDVSGEYDQVVGYAGITFH